MTVQEYSTKVWAFYLRLEKDFIESLNYVEFAEDNFTAYSIEFERMLLAVCSEVDVLCKLLCKEIAPTESPSKILEYANILCGYNDFSVCEVRFEKTGEIFKPFSNLTTTDTPTWWKAYNKVKHERTDDDNYKKGNLENVFKSLAALYALNRYYCRKIATSSVFNEPVPKSQLFNMVGWRSSVSLGNGFAHVLDPNGGMSIVHDNSQRNESMKIN